MNGTHSRHFPNDLSHLTDDEGGLEASDRHRGLGVVAELGGPLPVPPEPRVLQIHDHWAHIRW